MLHESDPYEWAKLHFSGAEMSDIRRVERVIKIATAVAQNPGASFGEMFGNWYDVKASYKLFGDEEATPEQLQAGHQWQVKENLKKPGVYALLEDTSDMVWAGREKIAGLGPIGNGSEKLQGFLLHSVLAVKWEDPKPEEGKRPGVEVIGLAHQEYYLRQPRPKKETRQASKQRARESQLWERATESLGKPPASEWVVWVRICDRGADIYEFMLSCQGVWSDRSSPLLGRPLLRTHRAPFNAVGSSIRKARYHPSRFNRTLTILEPQPTHFKRNGKAHQPKKPSAVICFLSSSWFSCRSRHLTPIGKSAPFPVGRCCIPYPGGYRQAFAFSPVPYPLT